MSTLSNTPDVKTEKRPVPYSAGIVGLDLTPQKERVALVLNIASTEVQFVPKDIAHRKNEYRDNIVKDARGDEVITTFPEGEFVTVRFLQPDGFGTMFGKGEEEDGGNPVTTALREALEESGMEMEQRIVSSVSHREEPQPWGRYFNIVYLANCVGAQFRTDLIHDDFVSKAHSGFYPLYALPLRRAQKKKDAKRKKKQDNEVPRFKTGMYQAAIRRIVAILLQLDRTLLQDLGRTECDNADDLVRMVLARVRYHSLFSARMLKMLVALKREDLILERLLHDRGIFDENYTDLARHIGTNIILWLPKASLNEGLETLLSRCDPGIRDRMEVFLGERLIRRKNTFAVYEDTHAINPDEKEVVEEEDTFAPPADHVPDYARGWLEAEAAENAWEKRDKRAADPAKSAGKEVRP